MECIVYDRLNYASFWRRFLADLIDGILLSIAFSVVSVIEGASLLQILIFFAYMIGFKGSRGTTPGYRAVGIRIVAINGEQVTVKQIVVRLFSAFFSALAFGLGFIWIAFDKRRQAWHDKIAGTYVIRADVEPVGTEEIPQTSLIRRRVFALVAGAACVIIICFVGGIMYLIKSSGAYALAEQYIRANPAIREMVGTPLEFGLFPTGNVSVSGESGEANLSIHVAGEKGEVTVVLVMEKRAGQWEIIQAYYVDKDGNYVDITQA